LRFVVRGHANSLAEIRSQVKFAARLTLIGRSGKSRAVPPEIFVMTAPEIAPPGATLGAKFLWPFRKRPRLFVAAAVAIVAYVLLPGELRVATRALMGWNVGSLFFIAMIVTMMIRSPRASIRRHAAEEDERNWVLLLIAVMAGAFAMAAIVWELGPVKDMTGATKAEHLALVGITIFSAWTFIHIMFALHYAGEYYARSVAADGSSGFRGGLAFPNENEPGWDEFIYQAFVIGCACATADVNATTSSMRGACLAQGIVAFFFNTIILALTINIGAGLF
jgi:uncharacterized membrane protein